jgi:uncharacterized membrane protein YphA (DoxX/SURF4 family)
MAMLSIGLTAAIRIGMVLLFLPFSALDKVLNFRGAVAQAREAAPNTAVATALILTGLFVEVFMSLGVITGIADRACAFVMAGYCGVTALLWKQLQYRSGPDAVLGLSEKYCAWRRLSAHHLWHRCGVGRPFPRPPVVVISSL